MRKQRKQKPLVTVAVNDNRLRLKFAPKLFPDGKAKYLALGLDDTAVNYLTAGAKVLEIERDILQNTFDISLDKYRTKAKVAAIDLSEIGQLWCEYLKYKQPSIKLSHYDYLANCLGKLVAANPYQKIADALSFRSWLLENTTIGQAKRALVYCNAATQWGIKNRLINFARSPYAGMSGDLPRHAWEIEGKPNALSLGEIAKVRAAFASHEDVNIENYAMFVDFLFLTGCRPSEAIGLRVADISPDREYLTFSGAIVRIRGQAHRTQGSKNNKARQFPLNQELHKLLDEAIWNTMAVNDLVFTSISGKTIDYSYFCRKVWKPIVTPIINRESTPYSCRDSFISHQLGKNMPPSNICAWCDTSIPVIQKRYLDPKLARIVKPANITESIQ
jgi:integrase